MTTMKPTNRNHLRALPSTSSTLSAPNRSGLDSLLDSHWFDKYLAPVAVGMTVLALGGAAVRGLVSGSSRPSGVSIQELKAMPSVPVTPDQNLAVQGAAALGERVDPWVYQGPNSNATTAANLDAEIAAQDPNGFIHAGETFEVPVIPLPEHPKK